MTRIHLNQTFSLPAEAHTNTFGILAVRGAGKSNTAAVMAEGFFDCHLPFVVVDPVGSWWGLRSSADGKGAGLAIPIFGGRHGDVPLERGGGELIANLILEKRLSCVLDLSRFESEGDKKKFLLDFARRLYKECTEPLHLFLEEADDYLPQRPMRDEAQLLRAFENIVRRGRSRGLGITLITQRSASVNKNVLTQIETLIAMRTTSPQDKAAIEAWVQFHGESKEILRTLDSLAAGEAWVWSPHFLKVCERVQIRRRRTFDSGATPKNSTSPRPAAVMADIDMKAIAAQMVETIAAAEASDPEVLRRKLAQALAAVRRLEAKAPAVSDAAVERATYDKGYAAGQSDTVARALDLFTTYDRALADALGLRIQQFSQDVCSELRTLKPPLQMAEAATRCDPPKRLTIPAPQIQKARTAPLTLSPCSRPQQAILDALAWLEAIGLKDGTRTIVGFLAGASPTSSAFKNNLGRLSTEGYISYPVSGSVALTPSGRNIANALDLPQNTLALHDMIFEKLPRPQRAILKAVIDVYPSSLTREIVAANAVASPTSSAFKNNLGSLRSIGLIDYPTRGEVAALPILFLR